MPERANARRRSRLIGALAGLALAAGCGSDEAGSPEFASEPAPAPADFPAADGRSLEQILADANPDPDLVVLPAGGVVTEGRQRFGFGIFTVDGEQVGGAEVALYAAPAGGGEAQGPFPARIESLETDPAFATETTSGDPDAAKVVYASQLEVEDRGELRLVAVARDGDELRSARIPSVVVKDYDEIPEPGDEAPVTHTPTSDDVGDLGQIDTRVPHDTMHETDLAEALGENPVVLLFATPALCESRVCGPVVDVAEQVKADYGDEVEFIHAEIYEQNNPNEGVRPHVADYGLPTEPWLFVIDDSGRVSTRIEGAFSVDELESAVAEVAP